MLVVIRGLETWRYLLEDAKTKFEIWTDYKNLKYSMKVQKLNQRQARWALYLSRFDSTLNHMLGFRMRKADGLSRRLDLKAEVDKGRVGKRNNRSSDRRTRNKISGKNKESKMRKQ